MFLSNHNLSGLVLLGAMLRFVNGCAIGGGLGTGDSCLVTDGTRCVSMYRFGGSLHDKCTNKGDFAGKCSPMELSMSDL